MSCEPSQLVVRALRQRDPALELVDLQVVKQVLRLVCQIALKREHGRRVIHQRHAADRVQVVEQQRVRLPHVPADERLDAEHLRTHVHGR